MRQGDAAPLSFAHATALRVLTAVPLPSPQRATAERRAQEAHRSRHAEQDMQLLLRTPRAAPAVAAAAASDADITASPSASAEATRPSTPHVGGSRLKRLVVAATPFNPPLQGPPAGRQPQQQPQQHSQQPPVEPAVTAALAELEKEQTELAGQLQQQQVQLDQLPAAVFAELEKLMRRQGVGGRTAAPTTPPVAASTIEELSRP